MLRSNFGIFQVFPMFVGEGSSPYAGLIGVRSSFGKYQAILHPPHEYKTGNKTDFKLSVLKYIMRALSKEIPLQTFAHLPNLKSNRYLSVEWSVTAAGLLFDEICLAPTDQAISPLRALSSHERLRHHLASK